MESPSDLLPEIRSTNAPAEMMRLLDWIMTSKPIPVRYAPVLTTCALIFCRMTCSLLLEMISWSRRSKRWGSQPRTRDELGLKSKLFFQCLDTGDDFPYDARIPAEDEQIPKSFADTLVRFLDSLVDSIMPAHLHVRCLEMTNRDEAFEVCPFSLRSSSNLALSYAL